MNYYNEFDPGAAAWLRQLVSEGLIPAGIVDERSIEDVHPSDLSGFTQCHFFAGIGGWSRALQLAGWPESKPVWTGSCPCFPAGTLILTQRGSVPIESVTVGDTVLTHKARWRPVTAVGSEESDLALVRGQGHWGLVTTPSHPFLTGPEEWTRAVDLRGKRWRTVARVPEADIPPVENGRGVMADRGAWRATGWRDGKTIYLGRYPSKQLAVDRRKVAVDAGEIDVRGADAVDPKTLGFARFLGYWTGDGWVSRNSVFLCGAKNHGPLLREIMLGAGLTCSESIERTTARARCGSSVLSTWLTENFGSSCRGKRLPAWLHGASPAYREAFLLGYAEADGHSDRSVKAWTTVSRALAVGIRILLNQAGVSASITFSWTRASEIEGREIPESGFYRVTAYQNARSFSFTQEHGVGLIRSVEPAGKGRVYNMSVLEDESYCADGIAVHNCQPFSSAGKGAGFDDERHLWPAFHHLISQCRPETVFGEQVASSDGLQWLDLVRADLEGSGWAVGAADLCAAGVGAPHVRQRLYWVADAQQHVRGCEAEPTDHVGAQADRSADQHGGHRGAPTRLADLHGAGCTPGREGREAPGRGLADADGKAWGRAERIPILGCSAGQTGRGAQESGRHGGDHRAVPLDGFWRDADWLGCRDGKWRPAEPSTFPLVNGLPTGVVPSRYSGLEINPQRSAEARVMRLRGYGNAIVPQVAATFIRAFL